MKIEDNHYTYRIETKDSNGGSLDFIDIDTVEPLRCAYDVQDELNLETNEHIKRVEEIVLDANSTEFWYVDEVRTSDTHLVCYFEEVELMASKDHPMVDTNRSVFEYGKINSNEHQNTNFICTHVMDNGVSRIYMSIDKTIFEFATFNNETIKHFISNNPVTVWYALRHEVIIPRSMSKGHLLTLGGQTDITLTTTSEQAKLPIMKFNIGDTQYTLDNNPIHINNTQEGTQIRNIVLEGNTPINYARGNGVNTTEATSDTRYDFTPFYDGQATIQGTVEGGYVSAKLYGDTMVNIAKPYGETPLLTATNENTLCGDLLGTNEEGIVLADGEITEGRIYGDSMVNHLLPSGLYVPPSGGNTSKKWNAIDRKLTLTCLAKTGTSWTGMQALAINDAQKARLVEGETYTLCFDIKQCTTNFDMQFYGTSFPVTSNSVGSYKKTFTYDPNKIILFSYVDSNGTDIDLTLEIEIKLLLKGDYVQESSSYMDGVEYFEGIGSVVNPTVTLNGIFKYGRLYHDNGDVDSSMSEMHTELLSCPTSPFNFYSNNSWNKVVFYDENKVFIESRQAGGMGVALEVVDIPINAKYVRFGFFIDNGLKGLTIKYTDGTDVYPNLQLTQTTFPYTLNKLPNGVADYIDVVNKVHVQRVGVVEDASVLNWNMWNDNPNPDGNARFVGFVSINVLPDGATINDATFMTDKLIPLHSMNNDLALYTVSELMFVTFLGLENNTLDGFKARMTELKPKILYPLSTPVYTPLTEEEIAQLPLSAYADGSVNLSSDQLMPLFEFRMRASNRYQVDMLETGYYYLNAPVGNVKLGTANVDVQQMPCIVKVDNVGTGDSGYRLGFDGEQIITHNLNLHDEIGYLNSFGQVEPGEGRDKVTPYMLVGDTVVIGLSNINNISSYAYSISYYDENKKHIRTVIDTIISNAITAITGIGSNVKYIRISMQLKTIITKNPNAIVTINSYPITLAKLPSHRIPTSFTQGMKCGTDFGYWGGIKEAKFDRLWTTNYDWSLCDDTKLSSPIQLNRIEYNNIIVEDEFDIATGKLTKRIGKITFTKELLDEITLSPGAYGSDGLDSHYIYIYGSEIPIKKKNGGIIVSNIARGNNTGYYNANAPVVASTYGNIWLFNLKDYASLVTKENKMDYLKRYCEKNPIEIYFELEVPEISYLMPTKNIVKISTDSKSIQISKFDDCLAAQVKPSHLTYPVPSLVGNRTYTVVHNRKNITGSTKPIELNLGGTVVQLNDASSKTLVKTPSTLAHSNLIFIGGESTVDHIMVLDGDWTNKPIEYFENMMGHDTDAIITIIGNGQINDVEEQYLW